MAVRWEPELPGGVKLGTNIIQQRNSWQDEKFCNIRQWDFFVSRKLLNNRLFYYAGS
jgi:hypothetical protein